MTHRDRRRLGQSPDLLLESGFIYDTNLISLGHACYERSSAQSIFCNLADRYHNSVGRLVVNRTAQWNNDDGLYAFVYRSARHHYERSTSKLLRTFSLFSWDIYPINIPLLNIYHRRHLDGFVLEIIHRVSQQALVLIIPRDGC
jgi:hypothetical protein